MDKSSSDIRKDLNNGEENTNCGFEWYSPQWLQGLASKKMYVLVYGFLGMNQTAIGSYFIGTISTIEKRFKLPSSASGLIASAWDLGALCTVVSLTYLGAGSHKARWVSACSIIAAISCYLRYLPYLLYGPQENLFLSSNSTISLCNTSVEDNHYCSFNSEGFTTWLILITANIGLGVGTSTYNTLGAAYLDDNSLKNKTPFLISVVTCLRYVGGMFGFLLASYALNKNEIPDINKSFDEKDESWIGAWYLGWMPLGTVHLVFALMMAAFPEILPREAKRRQSRSALYCNGRSSTGELKGTLTRLVKNPILVCNVLSATSHTFAVAGYWIFMPKYIETQFHQSPSRASLITGSVGLLCTIIGTFLSGIVISRYKPHARFLVGWSIFTKLVDLLAHLIFLFLTCGGHQTNDPSTSLLRLSPGSSECVASCYCSADYNPICSTTNRVLYFSPCHAGCTTTNVLGNGQVLFGNCSCMAANDESALAGSCAMNECYNNNSHFTIFLILLCLLKFLSYSSRAGNIIIQYRSVFE
ncbi:unnamed protein product [Nezara viridula]|uniref:Kazal-like domain-containing protein n=1 Tax=Nezara viridula TaxID=85310 RepID=A0A9P0MUM9_NEZVI|nr:unnamed protein product [Nezara viridula]